MRRILLSPAWWGRHLLMVVLVAVLSLLGRWQWDRAMSDTGSLQNLLYAFEWWIFAGLVVVGWWHLMRDELRAAAGQPLVTAGPPADDLPAFAVRRADRPVRGAVKGVAQGAAQDAAQEAADREADAELAAYNEYLAWLNANPRR